MTVNASPVTMGGRRADAAPRTICQASDEPMMGCRCPPPSPKEIWTKILKPIESMRERPRTPVTRDSTMRPRRERGWSAPITRFMDRFAAMNRPLAERSRDPVASAPKAAAFPSRLPTDSWNSPEDAGR